ncbi:MAG: hypothetical protein F6K48_23430 [Okeania sp. SIO3H1]|nr:hypothetical protein [Okeania sp. SIO3H1]
MVYKKKEYLAREQDAPTAVPRNKNNDDARPLQCTTTRTFRDGAIRSLALSNTILPYK